MFSIRNSQVASATAASENSLQEKLSPNEQYDLWLKHKQKYTPAKTGTEESPQTRVSIVQNHISKIKKKLKNGLKQTHTHTQKVQSFNKSIHLGVCRYILMESSNVTSKRRPLEVPDDSD